MKRFIGLLFVALLITGAMLTPVTLQVNYSSSNGQWTADGPGPIPPWPPSHSLPTRVTGPSINNLLTADGPGPIPPWPPSRSSATLVVNTIA